MNDKRTKYVTRYLTNCALALLAICSVGYLLGDYTKGIPGLYVLGKEGISYESLFQIALVMLFTTFYEYMLNRNEQTRQRSFIWKASIMMILCGVTTAVGCYIFTWFPIDFIEGWIGFIVSFLVCFILSISVMHWKNRNEERKYNTLLTDIQKEIQHERD